MKRLGIAAALCLLAGTSVAIAQDDQQQQPGTQQPGDAVAEHSAAPPAEPPLSAEEQARMQETVCRTTRMTGSLTRRSRTCMTRAEWADNARRTAQEVNRISGGAAGANSCQPDAGGGCL